MILAIISGTSIANFNNDSNTHYVEGHAAQCQLTHLLFAICNHFYRMRTVGSCPKKHYHYHSQNLGRQLVK